MNKNIIIKTLRHPLIKKLIENKALSKREMIKLIIQESILNENYDNQKDPEVIKQAFQLLVNASKKFPELVDFIKQIKANKINKTTYKKALRVVHPDRLGLKNKGVDIKSNPIYSPEDQKKIDYHQSLASALTNFSQTEKWNFVNAALGQKSQQGQGQPASEEVLKDVKALIAKYEKGYISFVKMLKDLKDDAGKYYEADNIAQIAKNLQVTLKEEIDLKTLEDKDPQKSYKKSVQALENLKKKIIQLIQKYVNETKKLPQISDAKETLKEELEDDLKQIRAYNAETNDTLLKNKGRIVDNIKALYQRSLDVPGMRNPANMPPEMSKRFDEIYKLLTGEDPPKKSKDDSGKQLPVALKAAGALVATKKDGTDVIVPPKAREKVLKIFELIKDWITVYKFIVTRFAKDVKQQGGQPQKQISQVNQKLIQDKLDDVVPDVEIFLPVPVKPEPDPDPEPNPKPDPDPKPDSDKTELEEEEPIDSAFVAEYEETYKLFIGNFLKVRTLKKQSDIFYMFHQAVLKLTGKPTDEIVGDQLKAISRSAQGRAPVQEQQVAQNSPVQGEKKEILVGAKVLQRHVKAVQSIMKDYDKYLGKMRGKEGVTVGSRELFQKFGESDPKKVLYKFVKLLAKDIDSMVDKLDGLIDAAQQPMNEQEQKNLSLEQKIRMVEKVHTYVENYGAKLLDAIAKYADEVEGDDTKPAEQPPGEPKPDEQTPGEEKPEEQQPQDLGEQEEGEKPRTPKAKEDVFGNYKQLALGIDEQLETIASFFPTARPFDSKYTMQAATKQFEAIIKRLDSMVADIQSFMRDQDITTETVKEFKEKLLAIKRVMQEIFGLAKSQKDAANQGAVSDTGKDSGLPQAGEGEAKEAGSAEELKKILEDTIEDYGPMNYLLRMIMATSAAANVADENAVPFKPILNSKKGKIVEPINTYRNSYKVSNRNLGFEEEKLKANISKASENLKSAPDQIRAQLLQMFKRVANAGTINSGALNEQKKGTATAMILRVGNMMLDFLTSFQLMNVLYRKLSVENEEISPDDIKLANNVVSEFIKNATLIQTRLNQYPIAKKREDFDPKSSVFYGDFHRFKMRGLSPARGTQADDEEAQGEETPGRKEKGEETPGEKEQQETDPTQEISGELVPKIVDEAGELLPKFKDEDGQLMVKNDDLLQMAREAARDVLGPDASEEEIESAAQKSAEFLRNVSEAKPEEPLEKKIKDPEVRKQAVKTTGPLKGAEGKDIDTRLKEFLSEEEAKVVSKFIEALIEQDVINEMRSSQLAGFFKVLGDEEKIKQALRSLSTDEKKILGDVVGSKEKRNKLLNVLGTVKKSDMKPKEEPKRQGLKLKQSKAKEVKTSLEAIVDGDQSKNDLDVVIQAFDDDEDSFEEFAQGLEGLSDEELEAEYASLEDFLDEFEVDGAPEELMNLLRDEVDEGESDPFRKLIDSMNVDDFFSGQAKDSLLKEPTAETSFKALESMDPDKRKESKEFKRVVGSLGGVYSLYSEEMKQQAKRAGYKNLKRLEERSYEKIKPFVERFNKLGIGQISHDDHRVFFTEVDPSKHKPEGYDPIKVRKLNGKIINVTEVHIPGIQKAQVITARY